MWRPARWIGALTLLACAAPGLAAQDLAQLCQTLGKLTVGQWASYTATGGPMDGATIRFAIVGSEQHGDSTFYWFELSHASSADPQRDGVVQALIPGWGIAGSPRGFIFKMGAQPAMRMPEQMLSLGTRMANPGAEIARLCATGQTVGWESVTVPAGTLRALHVKDTDGEAWISSSVPFGLVLGKKPDGGQLALSGRGGDAKSSITDTPQNLPMAPGAAGP